MEDYIIMCSMDSCTLTIILYALYVQLILQVYVYSGTSLKGHSEIRTPLH